MNRFFPWVCYFSLLCALVYVPVGAALEIDDFSSSALTLTANESESKSAAVPASAFGFFRSLFVKHATGSASVTLEVNAAGGFLSLDQGFNSTGNAIIVWDGSGSPRTSLASVNSSGFASIDLTEGGGTALSIVIAGKDLPALAVLRAHVFQYGSSVPASFELPLDYSIPFGSPQRVDIPFTSFAPSINFSQVGAIALEIDGTSEAVDLAISWIGTNGSCPSIPQLLEGDMYSVFDVCGECPADSGYEAPSGPLKSCLDCAGNPFGQALPGTSCQSSAPGQCAFGIWTDLGTTCACAPGEPSIEVCDGMDNNCDGTVDGPFQRFLGQPCGVDLPNCQIQGIYVCSGDGGIRCDADFDPANFEECGLVIGCDGIPGSDVRFDRCGICGGDGSSCVGCESVDIFGLLVELDGNAKAQEQLIQRVARRVIRRIGSQRATAAAQQARQDANFLQVRNWVLSWNIPSVHVTCPQTAENCVLVESTSTTAEYIENSIQMRRTAMALARRLLRNTGNTRTFRTYRRRAVRLHRKSVRLAAQVPPSTQRCF